MDHRADIFSDGSISIIKDTPQMRISIEAEGATVTQTQELTPEQYETLLPQTPELIHDAETGQIINGLDQNNDD